jgi:hypothetical protein
MIADRWAHLFREAIHRLEHGSGGVTRNQVEDHFGTARGSETVELLDDLIVLAVQLVIA